ncbi:MAG TPA: LuxR C-terminal-related transcriptional regulator [Amaricoccus sp.]|nr:LuxR C-terminal-related transcriptional regulator [Amaricoccus sp.]
MSSIAFELEIEPVTSLDDLWKRLVAFARGCGVARIGYHHLPPPGAPDAGQHRIENDGFPAPLLEQYLDARTSGVAVMAQALQNSVRPVYLEDIALLASAGTREREHLEAYRERGIVNGLGLQAFGPKGRNGIFALDLVPGLRRLAPEVMANLRGACQVMHLRYCELLLRELGEVPALSSRELEVLTWVAHGKTNALIAEILGISSHTVDAHLRRVYLKLGVADRISAAFRGLGFGLISLETGEPSRARRSR